MAVKCDICMRDDTSTPITLPWTLCAAHREELRIMNMTACEHATYQIGCKACESGNLAAIGRIPGFEWYAKARAGIKQPEPPPVYRIPARDVVPGMTVVEHVVLRRGKRVREVERRGLVVHLRLALGTLLCTADETVSVTLPGPSPRELCCGNGCHMQGAPRVVEARPSEHRQGCPVAPVEGLHGGMRLWPAPVRGHGWTWGTLGGVEGYDHDGDARDGTWSGLIVPEAIVDALIVPSRTDADRQWSEMVMQAFYHPPRATFEARPRDPWDRRWNGNTPWETEN